MRTFALAWAVSLCVYAAVHLPDEPAAMVLVAAAALSAGAGLAAAESRGLRLHRALVPALVLPASAAVGLWPLAFDLGAADDPRAALAGATVWPQLLVLLFAARLVAETAELAAGAAWRPGAGGWAGALHRTSIWSSLLLGGFLTLAFYATLARLAEGAEHPLADTLFGETPVNAIIVYVFAVALAEIGELWVGVLRDRALLSGLPGGGPEAVRARLSSLPPESLNGAAARRLVALVGAGDGHAAQRASGGAAAAEAALRAAGRRWLRTLVGSLPLIGFTGTVLGIMAALAALPDVLDGTVRDDGLSAALAGTLAGLATAFQTTLLGLVGSLVATLLLAALERAEVATLAAAELLAGTGEAPE